MTESSHATTRRGRPPGTSARELEVIALRLFTEKGFEETTVEEIAAAAGVTSRTFFRYFESKADVLWHGFDHEIEELRLALDGTAADLPLMAAVEQAVLAVNHYPPAQLPELRIRIQLLASIPALQASAALHYRAWEQAVSDFAAARTGQPVDSLFPLVLGRATLAACRAAYDLWAAAGNTDLQRYLSDAVGALAAGFDEKR
jgi:mycofactocin system transcriptional regulator